MEAMANNPKYAEYLTNEGDGGHVDVKKFTDRIAQKAVSIVVGVEKLEAVERGGMRRNTTVGVEFGFLVIFESNQEGNTLEACYQ